MNGFEILGFETRCFPTRFMPFRLPFQLWNNRRSDVWIDDLREASEAAMIGNFLSLLGLMAARAVIAAVGQYALRFPTLKSADVGSFGLPVMSAAALHVRALCLGFSAFTWSAWFSAWTLSILSPVPVGYLILAVTLMS